MSSSVCSWTWSLEERAHVAHHSIFARIVVANLMHVHNAHHETDKGCTEQRFSTCAQWVRIWSTVREHSRHFFNRISTNHCVGTENVRKNCATMVQVSPSSARCAGVDMVRWLFRNGALAIRMTSRVKIMRCRHTHFSGRSRRMKQKRGTSESFGTGGFQEGSLLRGVVRREQNTFRFFFKHSLKMKQF